MRVKYLPLDGLKRLLADPQGDDSLSRRIRAILALMGVHGHRVAEIAGLTLDDVDLSESVVRVLSKGRKVRTVYLTDQTTQVLADWWDVCGSVALDQVHAFFVVVVGPNGTGTAIGPRGIRYLVVKYLKDLGLKADGISCHALRHAVAMWARAGGVRLDAITGMLGHASVTTTGVYAKIANKIAENSARYLEQLMGLS